MLEVQIYKKLAEFDLDVSFQVHDNISGLMGASGSGKSMTLKCIAGIETPDQGRIVLNDRVLFDSEMYRFKNEMWAICFKAMLYFPIWMYMKILVWD